MAAAWCASESGDPLIFGRATEEMAALNEAGVVLGSCLPASHQPSPPPLPFPCSLTDRDSASSVTFFHRPPRRLARRMPNCPGIRRRHPHRLHAGPRPSYPRQPSGWREGLVPPPSLRSKCPAPRCPISKCCRPRSARSPTQRPPPRPAFSSPVGHPQCRRIHDSRPRRHRCPSLKQRPPPRGLAMPQRGANSPELCHRNSPIC